MIRKNLHEKGVCFSFYEVAHAQRKWFNRRRLEINHIDHSADAFIRDELSKGRYDPAISGICFQMLLELFGRTLNSNLGPRDGGEEKIEDVC